MNKLFLKIYGLFLFTIFLVGFAFIFVTISSLPMPPARGWDPAQPSARFVRQNLVRHLRSLIAVYESEGREAMGEHLANSPNLSRFYIFDENGSQLTFLPPPPPEVIELRTRLENSARREIQAPPLTGIRLLSPSRKTYISVVRIDDLFRFRGRMGFFNRFRASAYDNLTGEMAIGLLVVLLISGLLCFFLARHLTTPITRLRVVAGEITEGNLSARVGNGIGNRNDELADLSRDFDLMAQQIENLLKSRHRLIRDVSHELRSPLARLNVALELARKSQPGSIYPALDRIEKESLLLNQMIEQLLTLSRMESGTIESDSTPFDLGEILSIVAEDASFESSAKGIGVHLEKEGGLILNGHKDLMHSALENLIRNAVSYTSDNSTVEITLMKSVHGGRATAEIRVRDHGDGIPETELGKIFQPFYRLSPSRDRKSGGAGIGLAISERAVKLHHGTIEARNHPEGGLEIIVLLPL